jgi:hypothetical protein
MSITPQEQALLERHKEWVKMKHEQWIHHVDRRFKIKPKGRCWKGEYAAVDMNKIGHSTFTIYPEELAVWLATP